MSLTARLQPLFDWLLDGVEGTQSPAVVVGRVGRELRVAGVPVQRVAVFLRTLHPSVAGRRFTWNSTMHDAQVTEFPWGDLQTATFLSSPLSFVFGNGVEVRAALDGEAPLPFATLEELRTAGMTDYLALPLKFIGNNLNAVTFSTAEPGGFTAEQLEGLRWISRALSRVAETLALMRTAVNLLNTYVGRNAGERILDGRIQRGDTESIRCVIWFSDLRGFTALSDANSPAQTIAVLNELFECQVPAIEGQGGEVLKFIGDGMLAIFAIDAQCSAQAAAHAAVEASTQAFAALDKLNAGRMEPIRFGLSLHIGDVAYGNIGGAGRLDFTAIGAAVNLASRVEGLTGKLGKNVLLTEDVAKVLTRPTHAVGTFELKGLSQPQTVYELG